MRSKRWYAKTPNKAGCYLTTIGLKDESFRRKLILSQRFGEMTHAVLYLFIQNSACYLIRSAVQLQPSNRPTWSINQEVSQSKKTGIARLAESHL